MDFLWRQDCNPEVVGLSILLLHNDSGQVVHTHVSLAKQYNLVLNKELWLGR